jgi:hypothetical protein
LCSSEAPSQAHSYCDKFFSAIPVHCSIESLLLNSFPAEIETGIP